MARGKLCDFMSEGLKPEDREGTGDVIPSEKGEEVSGACAGGRKRLIGMAVFAVVLTGAFCLPLFGLMRYAMGTELHSHVVLIPFVTAWLIWTSGKAFQVSLGTSLTGMILFAALGVGGVIASLTPGTWLPLLSENDSFSLATASYLCLLVAGAFGFLGGTWMKKSAFPVFFLIFMIPLPDGMVVGMESALMVASAEASAWLFELSGMPVFRVGQDFHLPGFSLEVAQECSGIRSSWVLFITSLIGGHLFLRSNWRRGLFVAVVIPLGIVRNGLRILVIGWLCVHKGPHMIDHWIHHKGGPVFFALSLGPLFLFLWWLRRGERSRGKER
jgi:exosortase C (VPDSG-CTERM-specific)